jgi:membrane-associated protease RseP (regulator of RpoE activity)
MHKLTAGLVAAILSATSAAAIAEPDKKSSDPWGHVETFEWMSSSQGARLGVMVMSLTPELRGYFGAPDDKGVLIAKVEPGSAAAAAGLEVGDVIVDVKGNAVDEASDVIESLAGAKTGDTIKVAVVRDHKPLSLDAKITATRSATKAEPKWLEDMFPWLDDWPSWSHQQRQKST